MSNSILVIAEQRDAKLNKSSWEALVAAQFLAKHTDHSLLVVILGKDISDLAEEVAAKGVASVVVAEHEKLADYTPDGYTAALKQIIDAEEPEYVFFSHTYMVRDYAPKLATRLEKGLISDCVRIRVDNGRPVFVRQVYQGKIDADCVFQGSGPHLASIQVGAFNADNLETGEQASDIRHFDTDLDNVECRSKVLDIFEGVKQEVDLSKADRIVSVGRGIKAPENLELIKQLAEALDAEIAASRPVCDEGWLPLDRQIGSSGQNVAPKLYLAVGISGAIQHIVGMKNAQTIVAINKDPHAPIYDIADYGIVGDLFEVIPELTKAIKGT